MDLQSRGERAMKSHHVSGQEETLREERHAVVQFQVYIVYIKSLYVNYRQFSLGAKYMILKFFK